MPIYLDTTAPVSRVTEQGFYRNSSTFEIEWKSLSDYDDLEGYYIYYQVKNGSSLGDWTSLGYFSNNSFDFTGQNGITYRFKSIAEDSLGNLEVKGTYDTEVRIDLEKPKSTLWLVEGDNFTVVLVLDEWLTETFPYTLSPLETISTNA